MSPLLPNMGPPVENTHEPINEAELQQLVEALQQEAQKQPDGRLPSKVIDEVAARLGKKRSHAWAALALDPNLVPEMKYDTLFAVCVGPYFGIRKNPKESMVPMGLYCRASYAEYLTE